MSYSERIGSIIWMARCLSGMLFLFFVFYDYILEYSVSSGDLEYPVSLRKGGCNITIQPKDTKAALEKTMTVFFGILR